MPRPINIIVADDDKDDQLFFAEAINKVDIASYSITQVYDGQELMDCLLKKRKYSASLIPYPDFIILDLNMPLLDGLGALKQIKKTESLKKIPVFVLSTSAQESDVTESKKLGADGYYTKPIQIDHLKKIIEDILEKTNLDS